MSRIALVTGGSRGLGRSAVEHLAASGHDVVFTFQAQEQAAAEVVAAVAARGRRAVALRLDVTRPDTFGAFADAVRGALGGLGRDTFDVLIHNAGTAFHAPLLATTQDQLREVFGVHVDGPILLTAALAPLLADGGRVLLVSTGLTRFSLPGYGAYAAAKGAVEVVGRYLARELAPRRISVNTVAPGATATDFGGGRLRGDPGMQAMVSQVTALGRPGQPDDIGGAIAALVAPEAGWMTGQRIEVSGGMFL